MIQWEMYICDMGHDGIYPVKRTLSLSDWITIKFQYIILGKMALRKVASELVTGLGVRVAVPQTTTSGSSTLMALSSSFMKRGFATGTFRLIDMCFLSTFMDDDVGINAGHVLHCRGYISELVDLSKP